MRQVERNALDESAMVAFSIALNQAQSAVAERRAMLTAQGVLPVPAVETAPPAEAPARPVETAGVVPLRFAAE
jgi:hypothetical protein